MPKLLWTMTTHCQTLQTAARVELPIFLTIAETQSIYGGKTGWYRKVILQRQIPYFKRGGRVVFSREDLDTYFRSRRVAPRCETAE